MSISTNLISGLSSGFDWRSMIDQLMAIEHQRVDLVEDKKTEYESKLSILQSVNRKLLSFKTKAGTLASSDAFNIFTSSLSTDSANYSASSFLSVSTNTSAAPGGHTITMNSNSSVAQSRQISSKSFSTYDTELGLTGEFVINGRAVSVESSDDLNDIMSKINNLNSGTNATDVTASILTVSSSNYRLILMSDETGEDAFTIFDASADAVNILSADLGFTDGTTSVKNYVSNGFQSEAFSSSTQAVGSILGLSSAQDGTVTIGDCNAVAIDLSQDSLTDIAEAINDRAGDLVSNVSASVVSTTEDGVTTYRLKIENTTGYTDDDNVLQTLGLLKGDQGDVAEVHLSDTANTKVAGGDIEATTAWEDIDTTGDPGNDIVNNDTILIKGTKHDGTTVDTIFTITDKTLAINNAGNNFLAAIESAFGDVTAEIDAGKIKVTDDTAGDSQLSISLICQNEGDGSFDLGTITASTEGYTMETQAGQDANIIIDGTAVTSSSNIIDEVIAGVTLDLLTVEDLEPADDDVHVTMTVSRNYNTIKSSVQGLLDAYNDVISDINAQFAYNEETETAGLLQGDSTLYSIRSGLQNIVSNAITGLPTTTNALSLIGITTQIDIISHENDGTLAIDDDDFMDALEDNFNSVRRIFVAEGTTTDGDVQYIDHSNDTVAGEYAVNITTVATQAEVTGTVALTNGIGDGNVETVTIKQGPRVAGITLYDADGENGTSIDNIVNAINSEFDTEYAQGLMGSVKNTTDAAQTTAITSSTTWDAVYSGGVDAGLLADAGEDDYEYEIAFTGHKKNGTEVSATYTINDAGTDTVQGLLSAIEAAYGYEVSAGINTYGCLVITDNTTGDSSLDITITEPAGNNLDFGYVTTSNLVSSEKNTETVSGDPIDATTKWDDISGGSLQTNDVIKFAGWTLDGDPVEGTFTVDLLNAAYDDVGDFLDEIESAYSLSGGSVTAGIVDGRIVITDGTTNSTLGVEIFEPSNRTLDFGTLSGGVTGRYEVGVTASKDGSDQLVLTYDEYGSSASFTVQLSEIPSDLGLANQTHSGIDVVGTINDESATGSGQVLTGDEPESGETTSVQGLVIKYTGTGTGSQGNVEITMGVAELFDRVLYGITNTADGYLDYRIESMGDRIDDFEDNIEEMEARLNRKMETMINRFVAMEMALNKIQTQSDWLAGQLQASFSAWK